MANYDYFKQYVSEMERIKAKTAHDEHIIEFRAMCAKMIGDAIPEIKEQCVQECMRRIKDEEQKPKEISAYITNVKGVAQNLANDLADALKKIFK